MKKVIRKLIYSIVVDILNEEKAKEDAVNECIALENSKQ
jgi:hypothetical protein